MDNGRGGGPIVPTIAKRRIQFSLAQLLLAVLSIGGCLSAWRVGWISLMLPILFGWLWWLAYGWKSWPVRVFLCLVVPSMLIFFGLGTVFFSPSQSQVQRALPLDWYSVQLAAAEDQQRMEALRAGTPLEVSVYPESMMWTWIWTWLVLVPLGLAALGVLLVHRPWIRSSCRGWTALGSGLGLLVVLILAGYPVLRSVLRKSALRGNWHRAELVYREDNTSVSIQVSEQRSISCSTNRSLLIKERAYWSSCDRLSPVSEQKAQEREEAFCRRNLSVDISPQDAEELWRLLVSTGVFSFNPNLHTSGEIDGSVGYLKISAGSESLQIRTYLDSLQHRPMFRLKKQLREWLRSKGFLQPADLLNERCAEEEYFSEFTEDDEWAPRQ